MWAEQTKGATEKNKITSLSHIPIDLIFRSGEGKDAEF